MHPHPVALTTVTFSTDGEELAVWGMVPSSPGPGPVSGLGAHGVTVWSQVRLSSLETRMGSWL